SVKIDLKVPCFDAGPNGFLVRELVRGQGRLQDALVCRDSKTGDVLWSRPDLASTSGLPAWAGDHVVAITPIDNHSAAPTFKLQIVDRSSGETVGESDVPTSLEASFMVRDDTILFEDQKHRHYAYKIVEG